MTLMKMIGIINEVYNENGNHFAVVNACFDTKYDPKKAERITIPITQEMHYAYIDEEREASRDGLDRKVMIQGQFEMKAEEKSALEDIR